MTSSLVVLGDVGDNPLAYWEEIEWDTDKAWKCLDRNQESSHSETSSPSETDAAFESEIQRNPYSVKLWILYLESRKMMSTAGRFSLYERSVKFLPRSYKLWYRYLQERLASLVGVPFSSPLYTVMNNTFERCLVHLSQMPRLWLMYLDFLQTQPLVTKTRRCFDRSLQSLPITQHHRIWDVYIPWVNRMQIPAMALVVYRRYLMIEPSKVVGYIDLLKRHGKYDEAAVTLANTLDEDCVQVEGKTSHQLWMDLCELISQHPESIVSLDVEAVLRSGLRRFTDQVGRLWCSLADHYVLSSQMDKARDIYEEALATVATTHDFGVVFDTYAKFTESLVSKLMQSQTASPIEVDLLLARLEDLVQRRPILLSSVKLRQNPHNVVEWLNRIKLFAEEPEKVVKTFTEAVITIDPFHSVGKVTHLWMKFAQYYEVHDDMANARAVFEKATKAKFRSVEDLAGIWCAWVEMELRHGNTKEALDVARRSIHRPSASEIEGSLSRGMHQRILYRNVRLWSLCADIEESFGTFATLKACYEKMFDLKVITPAQVLTYTTYLEENRYWEESFRVYEKGVAVFRWPHVYDVWVIYLAKFVARYGGRKLERARELFEQALVDAPSHLAKRLFLMYAKLEEEYGLARHAIKIYERATQVLEEPNEVYQFYCLLVAKTAEFFGLTRTRPIFEAGIEKLSATDASTHLAVKLSERFSEVERGLGETDRSRSILQHASQFCDPKKATEFWQKWREFEVAHGNEDTFRDMLRTKRSVQAIYAQSSVKEIQDIIQANAGGGEDGSAMAALEAQAEREMS